MLNLELRRKPLTFKQSDEGGLLNGNKTTQNICVYTETIGPFIMEMESYGYWSAVAVSLKSDVPSSFIIQHSVFNIRHLTVAKE